MIDPNLLVVKAVSELEEVSVVEPGSLLFYDGGDNLKRINTELFYQLLNNIAKPIDVADAGPFTANRWYKPEVSSEDPGTNYPNAGDLKAIEGYDTLFYYDGTDWTKVQNKLPGLDKDQVFDIIESSKEALQSVVEGGDFSNTNQNFTKANYIKSTDNAYLNNLGIYNLNYENIGTNVENYWFFLNNGVSPTDDVAQLFAANNGNYVRFEWYIYSKDGIEPANLEAGRLGVAVQATGGNVLLVGSNSPNGAVTITQVDPEVFKIEKTVKIDFSGTLTSFYIATVLEDTQVPVGYEEGDFAITGLKIAFGNEYIQYSDFVGDWEVDAVSDAELLKVNNLPVNIGKVAPFFLKYDNKNGGTFNQIDIIVGGNSIGGRQADGELPYTPDSNGGAGLGKDTGHFPPNMWQQIIAYKILQALQFADADVKYYNHTASEVTKVGTWANLYPAGADALRIARTTTQNDYIQLAFTGAALAKFIYSCYTVNTQYRKIEVTISDDGGSTWQSPGDLGLIESYESDAEGSGIYFLPPQQHKFGCIIWKGFDKATSYLLRVKQVDPSPGAPLAVWGFETWSNTRINVIVNAEGGNTADDQDTAWWRFYNTMQNQDLIIYELPYLNDLGTGIINKFKGKANLSTTPSSPALNDFYYADVDGTYTNFSSLVLKKGDYFEYNGSVWVKGSTQLNTVLSNYLVKNENIFKKLASIGVPVLTVITHNAENSYNRPFTYENGLSILRNLVAKYGFASIDINYLQQLKGYSTGIFSDGTHLNSKGVSMYADEILKLLKIPAEQRFVSSSDFRNQTLKGSGSGASMVNFGYEFSKTPTVRIYNNSSIQITAVTQKSFTVTGTGAFDYEVFV